MYKKIGCLTLLSLLTCSAVGLCAAPKPSKHIVLIYKVPDAILMCQNSTEDMVKGQVELEKELQTHYSKRFIVDEIKRAPFTQAMSASEYISMVKPTQTPFVLKLDLVGTGSSTNTFQNVFGAQKSITVPTVKIVRSEHVADPSDMTLYGVTYDIVEYQPNVMPLGGNLYSSADARKNTKNGVRGYIRDYCTWQGDQINKYADMAGYNRYSNAYTGDFKKDIVESFPADPTKPYFGFSFNYSLIVTLTGEGLPYHSAGGRINDQLKAINDQPVSTELDYNEVIKSVKPGQNVSFKVLRNGEEVIINVTPLPKTLNIFKQVKI